LAEESIELVEGARSYVAPSSAKLKRASLRREQLSRRRSAPLSKINTAFNVGARVGICDTSLANYGYEANNRCAAKCGRFESEAPAQCSAPGKSTAQVLTCSCLVPAITAAIEAKCVALSQSPEILAAVNTTYRSCNQREINIGGLLTHILEQVIKRLRLVGISELVALVRRDDHAYWC
jgi:hypothetical protein